MTIKLNKRKIIKFLKYFSLSLIGIMILIIGGLEIASRISDCPTASKEDWPSCFGSYALPENSWDVLTNLYNKRMNHEKIEEKEYQESFPYLMVELDAEKMGPLNGLSCGSFGLIRDDLPQQAKLFVMRHELEHMLGSEYFMPPNKQEGFIQNEEFLANWAAFKEYPGGGIETVVFSLMKGNKKLTGCSIIKTWQTFKTYFLPFESRQNGINKEDS